MGISIPAEEIEALAEVLLNEWSNYSWNTAPRHVREDSREEAAAALEHMIKRGWKMPEKD